MKRICGNLTLVPSRCLRFWPMLCFYFIAGVFGAPDNAGHEFLVVYMENEASSNTISLELYVTTNRHVYVNVNITSPLRSGVNFQFNVIAGFVKKLQIPSDFYLQGSARSDSAILVQADDEILVYTVNKGEYTNDAYMALPTDVLGHQYLTVSYAPASKKTQFAIAALEDCVATITLANPQTFFDVTLGTQYYTNGETFSLTLSAYETLQIQSDGDLSGTFISSTKPVAVYSGNVRTRVDGYSSDHLVEQLPPVSTLGKTFALVPTPGRTVGDLVKCIASESQTTITISNYGSFFLANRGDSKQVFVSSSDYITISADNPILVVQIVKSQETAASLEEADPSMAVIFPVEQYASDTTIATPEYSLDGSYTNFFMIVVKSSEKDGLRVDHQPLNQAVQWTAFPGNLDLVGGQIPIENGSHVIYHESPTVTFGGILYGYAQYESFSLPLGMRLAPVNLPCVVTRTSTGDGVDNDCDGLIDEENCGDDKVDDDKDGNVDEDCAKNIADVIGLNFSSLPTETTTTLGQSSNGETLLPDITTTLQQTFESSNPEWSTESFYPKSDQSSATEDIKGVLSTTDELQSRKSSLEMSTTPSYGTQRDDVTSDLTLKTNYVNQTTTSSISNQASMSCPGGFFYCGDDSELCIETSFLCDCHNDCPDGRDEMRHLVGCSKHEMKCSDKSGVGIHQSLTCHLFLVSLLFTWFVK